MCILKDRLCCLICSFRLEISWCSNGRRSNKCFDASWVNNVKAMRFILALPKQLTQPTLFIEQDCVSHANLPQVFVDTLTKARKGKLKIKHINSDITVGGNNKIKTKKKRKEANGWGRQHISIKALLKALF